MKILITGGTGFVGSFLTARLVRDGHEVTILIRSEDEAKMGSRDALFLVGNPTAPGRWQEKIGNFDAIINLAGASIFSRWTVEQKRIIRESRISTTKNLVESIVAVPGRAVTLLSTSAVGYYGFHGDEELAEEATPGDDFLALVARDWEAEALKARQKGARVCITRFGIVLGTNGGALGQMLPLFRMFLGGPIGSGRQWFSWIHAQDLVEAFCFLLNHKELSGPFNVCSPRPVTNRDLARAIGKALHRPSLLPAPGFMIRLMLGEFGSVILQGQRVVPRRLLENGFVFQHPEIDGAIASIVAK